MSINLPKKASGDQLHTSAKVLLSAIPAVGGSFAEIFNALVAPPLEKRREKWFREVTETLNKVAQERQVSMEKMFQNEQFLSLLTQSTLVAMRTHQEEKINYLKNAIIRGVDAGKKLYDKYHCFIRLVDDFTVSHIAILVFLQDPKKIVEQQSIKLTEAANYDKARLIHESIGPFDIPVNFALNEFANYGMLNLKYDSQSFMHDAKKLLTESPALSRPASFSSLNLQSQKAPKQGKSEPLLTRSNVLMKHTSGFADEFLAFICED